MRPTKRKHRPAQLALVAAAGLVLAAATGCDALSDVSTGEPAASQAAGDFSEYVPFDIEVDAAELTAAIEALVVAGEQRKGYDRDLFAHWSDSDGNGCDARDDVLVAQDRSGTLSEDDCDGPMTGQWVSMYDGQTITDSSDLDIDHMVPLAEAWDSGAHAWSATEREQFANQLDPWHLVAVTATSNRSKSDQDPAEWMPELEAVHCAYVWAWVQVKTNWDLTVDQAEQTALLETAGSC